MAIDILYGGTFQDPSGGPLINGYVSLALSAPAMSPNGLITQYEYVTANLDANGNLSPNLSLHIPRPFRWAARQRLRHTGTLCSGNVPQRSDRTV